MGGGAQDDILKGVRVLAYSDRSVAGLATGLFSPSALIPRPSPEKYLRPEPRSARSVALTRRYEIAWLDEAGEIRFDTRVAPAIGEIEEASSAFARGTIVLTSKGPVAVEDLLPGMELVIDNDATSTVIWIGSMSVMPQRTSRKLETTSMVRVTADALGHGRPGADRLLGPRARILMRDQRARNLSGAPAAYVPLSCFIDGVTTVEITPVAPVTAYHIVLEKQGSIRSGGLEFESYHPGAHLHDRLDAELGAKFFTLFPNLRTPGDFGPAAHPRLSGKDYDEAVLTM